MLTSAGIYTILQTLYEYCAASLLAYPTLLQGAQFAFAEGTNLFAFLECFLNRVSRYRFKNSTSATVLRGASSIVVPPLLDNRAISNRVPFIRFEIGIQYLLVPKDSARRAEDRGASAVFIRMIQIRAKRGNLSFVTCRAAQSTPHRT